MNDRSSDKKFVKWARAVKERDNYICQLCGSRGVTLNSHHINSWDVFIDQRYDLENGITLCQDHHSWFHSIYGKGNNTRFQFEEFKVFLRLFRQLARKNMKP